MTDAAATWAELAELPVRTLAALFDGDPDRVAKLTGTLALPDVGDIADSGGVIRFDWSKTHLDDALLDRFEALAERDGFCRKARGLVRGRGGQPDRGTRRDAHRHARVRQRGGGGGG